MDDLVVTDMKIVPCVNSKYVQSSRLKFNQVRTKIIGIIPFKNFNDISTQLKAGQLLQTGYWNLIFIA